jgi:hypothetical protein
VARACASHKAELEDDRVRAGSAPQGLLVMGMGEGTGEMSGLKRAFMGLPHGDCKSQRVLAAPAVASGYHRDMGPRAMVKPIARNGFGRIADFAPDFRTV